MESSEERQQPRGLHVKARLYADDEVFWLYDVNEATAYEGGIMLKLPDLHGAGSPIARRFTLMVESGDGNYIGLNEFMVQVHRA